MTSGSARDGVVGGIGTASPEAAWGGTLGAEEDAMVETLRQGHSGTNAGG